MISCDPAGVDGSNTSGHEIDTRHRGRVAEWFKAAVLKTARGFTPPRGFESHPFRQPRWESGHE
jgi:hypothetical protein